MSFRSRLQSSSLPPVIPLVLPATTRKRKKNPLIFLIAVGGCVSGIGCNSWRSIAVGS